MKPHHRLRRAGERGTLQRLTEQRTAWPQTLRHHSLPLTNLVEADPPKTQQQQPIKRKRSQLHLGVELGGAEREQHPPKIPPQQPHLNQSVARYQNNRKKPIPSGQDNRGRLTCKGKDIRFISHIHSWCIDLNSELSVTFLILLERNLYCDRTCDCDYGCRQLFPKAARLAKPDEHVFSHTPYHQPTYGSEGETERDLDSSPDCFRSFTQLVEDQGKPSSSESLSHKQGKSIHGAGQGQLAVSFRQVPSCRSKINKQSPIVV